MALSMIEIKSTWDKDYKMNTDSCLWGSFTPSITPHYELKRTKEKDMFLNWASRHMFEPLAGEWAVATRHLQDIHSSTQWSCCLFATSKLRKTCRLWLGQRASQNQWKCLLNAFGCIWVRNESLKKFSFYRWRNRWDANLKFLTWW